MSTRRSPDGGKLAQRTTDASPERMTNRAQTGSVGRTRVVAFAILCAACVTVAVGYLVMARIRLDTQEQQALTASTVAAAQVKQPDGQPHMIFLHTQGDAYRRVAQVGLDVADGPRSLTPLRCQRVAMAAGQGVCLGTTSRGGGFTFGPDFQQRYTFPIMGAPSRARVSPDGRYGAITVFVRGHSYDSIGFSTQTHIIDMSTGVMLGADAMDGGNGRPGLEGFTVYRDGARFRAQDENYWGVTFAQDGNRFYATLGTGGKTYLIEGDIERQEARILKENVECPSLSPDGTRLAFKKRVGGGGISPFIWQLHLLDLATLTETSLTETRNVDDQVEWLDDQHILYALLDEDTSVSIRPDIWQLALDGSAPSLFATGAMSPTIVRQPASRAVDRPPPGGEEGRTSLSEPHSVVIWQKSTRL